MSRGRAIFLTLLGAALTGAILWFLPGETGDRMFSIAAALFFGACALVGISYIVRARIPEEELDGAIVVPNSPMRSLFMAIALIMITAAALIMWPAISTDDDWRRFVFLLIPLPCAFLAFKYLQWGLSGAPAYRFDREGVTRYQWGERTTPWAAVTNVRILNVRGTESVVLDVTAEHRKSASFWSRFSGSTGFGDVSLPSGASGLAPKDIEALVRRFWPTAAH